jgi:hypothetical protein
MICQPKTIFFKDKIKAYPYLHVYYARGKAFVYFRRGHFKHRIKAALFSHKFDKAYQSCLAGGEALGHRAITFEGLCQDYLSSPEYEGLTPRRYFSHDVASL